VWGQNRTNGAPHGTPQTASIPDALLDQLLDGTNPRTAFNPDGVLDALKRALAERMLNAEMDQHLEPRTTELIQACARWMPHKAIAGLLNRTEKRTGRLNGWMANGLSVGKSR
jgi:hypothetical protein